MSSLKLPVKYAIDLRVFDEIFQHPKWRWKIIHTSYGDNFGQGIENWVKEAKLGLKSKFAPILDDYDSPAFLPCLINYIAIDRKRGEEVLDYVYSHIQTQAKKNLLKFFENHLDSTFKDFSAINISFESDLEHFKTWVEERIKMTKSIRENLKIKLFDLSTLQIDAIIQELSLKGVISQKEVRQVINFFQNKPNDKVYFKTAKNVILDLLRRILFVQEQKRYNKQRAVQELEGKIYYHRNKNYTPLTFKALKDGFSDESLRPKRVENRLLISLFPDSK